MSQPLVTTHGIVCRECLGRFAGADDIDPIQFGLKFNGVLLPLPFEMPVPDVQVEMFGHLVMVDDSSYLQPNLILPERFLGAPLHFPCNPRQFLLCCLQQLFALASAFLAQKRIETRHKPLARIVWRLDLGQVLLVKKR